MSPSKKNIKATGFRYDEDPSKTKKNDEDSKLSPTSEQKRATGLAFNYAPGENVRESVDKLKHGELSPRSRDKLQKDGAKSPVADDSNQKDKHPASTKSYSPTSGGNKSNIFPSVAGTYRPTDDPSSKFIEGERYDKDLAFVPSELKTAGAPVEPKKKIKVKIMVITGKIDPKSKKIDAMNGDVEHSIGVMDVESGKIETQYGVIDSKKGTVDAINRSGKPVALKGQIDGKTGHIYLGEGILDKKTDEIVYDVGQVISYVPEKNPMVEIVTITGKVDAATGKIDTVNGDIEKFKGILNPEEGTVHTKYGEINFKTGEVKAFDSKLGKYVSKPGKVDPANDQVTIVGVADPKHSGKVDNSQGHLVSMGHTIDPIVEVVSIFGKVDKKGNMDPKTTVIESSTGQIEPSTGKINTKFGQFDLIKNTITFVDPKTGKTEVKEAKVDPQTGQVLLKNQTNPKTNKPDKDFGRLISLHVVDLNAQKNRPSDDAAKDIRLDPKTNQIWTASGKDPKTGETIYTSSFVDKTGYVITLYGYLNPKTNEIDKQTKLDPNVLKIDPTSGQIYTATNETDETTGEPLYSISEVNHDTGEMYTKVGRFDPKTGKIVIIKVFLLSKKDEKGKPEEVDLKSVEFDKNGRILNVVTNTIYVYKMVDPVTGEVVSVDPNDPRISGARTTVTQTLTLSGEIDPVSGRIKTEYGHIDPSTGDIDPDTAVRDPITGKLILNYADIDPKNFGKSVTVTKETVPITREQFYEGTKHLGSHVLKHDDDQYDESVEDVANSFTPGKIYGQPTVVKTTTKQTITKTDDGVTHNVEEKIQNLGTGEVTYSTQEHKVNNFLTNISNP